MIVYRATNTENGKVYIGQTVKSMPKRRAEHHHRAFVKNEKGYFYNALRKYGKDGFIWEVVQECETIDEMNDAEIRAIQIHKSNRRTFGYNLKEGGRNAKHTEETKRLLSEKRKGFKFTKKSKKKMSDSKKGSLNFMYGKHWSSNVKKRQSASRKDKKPVIQIDSENGNFIAEFESVSDAQRTTGIHNISATCQGRYKRHGGFIWMYKADYELLTKKEKKELPVLHCLETNKGKSNPNGSSSLKEYYAKNKHHAKGKKMIDILGENGFESWKRKCAKAKYKPVIQYDKENMSELNKFESLKEASEKTGLQKMSISNACRGKTNSAYGYKWKYVEKSQDATKEK